VVQHRLDDMAVHGTLYVSVQLIHTSFNCHLLMVHYLLNSINGVIYYLTTFKYRYTKLLMQFTDVHVGNVTVLISRKKVTKKSFLIITD